ncbi:hypothetical protein BGZ63DRAFT_440805 [Mariannaea sp. PMI_226]|nr:hypothetical protein BGZ63DRAFT_440805 [Mariannaea sp. PMI_226]
MFRAQNPMICRHYIQSYISNITISKNHILWPFHAYRSVPGFINSAYNNYIWGAKSCNWSNLAGYFAPSNNFGIPSDLLKGKDCPKNPLEYQLNSLNHSSYPQITNQFPIG